MLDEEMIIELIDNYCDSCPHNGNCDQTGCEKKAAYSRGLIAEYKAQFDERDY